MLNVIKALSQTSLPGIIAFTGVVFIFLSIGGKLGAQIITDNISKRCAGIIGFILLMISLAMFAVSTNIQIKKTSFAHVEKAGNHIASNESNEKMYNLRPVIPTNVPIMQTVDFEWKCSTDKSTKCTIVTHNKNIITILGRYPDGEASVAKRKTVSNLSTTTCITAGEEKPKITKTHGPLEGKELIAHKTAEGLWVFDKIPGATEKQKEAMKDNGFIEPFVDFPNEKVPVGKVILLKNEDISLAIGPVFPGRIEGTEAIKFDRIIKEREAVAQLSVSMNFSITTLDENNNEILVKMLLNGGGSLSLSNNTKLHCSMDLKGIVTSGKTDSHNTLAGPAKIKITIKEL